MRVGRSLAGSSDMVAEVDELEDVFDAVHRLLGQTDDDDLLLPVLQNSQLGFSGEEIKNLKIFQVSS